MAEKQEATELQKNTESRYKRLRQKYNHYKNKEKRLLKQLSFVPWLWDLGWALGFNWGFEDFSNLVLNPDRFDIQPENVTFTFLRVPDQGILELEGLGVQFFLDVPDWSKNALNPHGGIHLLSDIASEPTSNGVTESRNATEDEDGIEGEDAEEDFFFFFFEFDVVCLVSYDGY